jgi:hypothetical protein
MREQHGRYPDVRRRERASERGISAQRCTHVKPPLHVMHVISNGKHVRASLIPSRLYDKATANTAA